MFDRSILFSFFFFDSWIFVLFGNFWGLPCFFFIRIIVVPG